MIVEAQLAMDGLSSRLILLKEERDLYQLANEDVIPPFLFDRTMAEYDRQIEELEESLQEWDEEYEDMLRCESEDYAETEENPFDAVFYDLARIDGVPQRLYGE